MFHGVSGPGGDTDSPPAPNVDSPWVLQEFDGNAWIEVGLGRTQEEVDGFLYESDEGSSEA